MATIITKNSQTASAVPSAASLSVGELAVNTADGKLYTEHTGGVVKEIIPSTVVDGGITANKLASNAVTTAKIADANVTGAKLENSGVSAGTYTIATVTVDAKGRITSASSGSSGAPTTAQVLAANVGFTAGAVGSFCVGGRAESSAVGVGSTTSGSNIRGYDSSGAVFFPFSGTWRNLGTSQLSTPGYTYAQPLFVRIS